MQDPIPQIHPVSVLDPVSVQNDVMERGATQVPPILKTKRNRKKVMKIASVFAAVLGVLVVMSVFLVVLPGVKIYKSGKVLAARSQKLQVVADAQDLTQIKSELALLKTELATFRNDYKGMQWTRSMPFVGPYYRDGEAGLAAATYGMDTGDLIIATIEPYADIIGLKGGSQATSGLDSANDRLEFVVNTIKDIIPKMGTISEQATKAHAELVKIDPNRYPEEFRGIKVREKLTNALTLASQGTQMLAESKPLVEAAPYLLGVDEARTYLLLFQNDKELRATGGFITAYSIVNVSKGKIEPVASSDIYSLDNKYTPSVPAPSMFVKYLKAPYVASNNFRLRDMNWSPDFKTSMELFLTEADKAGLPDIDGVIAVDTHVVVNILNVLGEIGVSGFGNFSTKNDPRCNCPQVIYELEDFADQEGAVVWSENEPGKIVFAPKNYGKNRKEIVGPLMNSILSNALGQPKDKLPALFTAGWESVINKHILLYMFDQKAQAGVESFKIAGRILETEGDYLHVNDSNLGGRKSNLYVTQEVSQEVVVARDGTIEKTVTLTYRNPQKYDGWLNSVLPNWTRIYVPKGSTLIEAQGFENPGETYEDLGKTVFSGGFELRPEGVKQIVVKYKLPFKAQGNLKMLIQKQPGTDSPLHSVTVGRRKEELFLKTDTEFSFAI